MKKTKDLATALDLKLITTATEDHNIDGCFVGDLLSWAIAKLQENNIWLTVMGNINTIAVAKLTDAACIVLCDNATIDPEAKKQADTNGIPVYRTQKDAYSVAIETYHFLENL